MGKKLWEGKMWVLGNKDRIEKPGGFPKLFATRRYAKLWITPRQEPVRVRVTVELDE